jgi:hypothetical protein
MKFLMVLACAFALPGIAFAADHGPVFSYATPVNSQRELSFDTGIFGRNGSRGTQFSTGSGFGYGVTPHITVNAFLPATFSSGSLPESRIVPGNEWSAGASGGFCIRSRALGSGSNRPPPSVSWFPDRSRIPASLPVFIEHRASQDLSQPALLPEVNMPGLAEAMRALRKPRTIEDQTLSPGAEFTATARQSSAEATISGTIEASQS